MTMTNQGDEAVRLVPDEASKKSGLPGEASMRTPLTGSSSFQLSSRSAGSSSGAVPCDRLAWLLDA